MESSRLIILQTTAIWSRQHHTIGILSGRSRRLVEIEEALGVLFAILLVSHFRTGGSRWSESLDRAMVLLLALLEGYVVHQCALRRLNLIEELTSI